MKRERKEHGIRRLDPHPQSPARALAVVFGVAVAASAFAYVLFASLMPPERASDRSDAVTELPAGPVTDPDNDSPAVAPSSEPMEALLQAIAVNDAGRVDDAAGRLEAGAADRVVRGKTPLMHAASVGNASVLQALLRHGADPNARGASLRTALQYAAERNHVAAARALLDAGADVDGYDDTGLTPLIMAADRGHTELALLLIERGADVNLAHTQGWTALIDAARTGNAVLVERLLSHGADVGARMPRGQTARDLAAQGGHAEIVRLLDNPQPAARLDAAPVHRQH